MATTVLALPAKNGRGAPYVSWYHKLSLLPRDPVHLDFQLTRITYVITLYNVILRIARNYLETRAKFQPIHSTVQIWTDYNENEAKKIFLKKKN